MRNFVNQFRAQRLRRACGSVGFRNIRAIAETELMPLSCDFVHACVTKALRLAVCTSSELRMLDRIRVAFVAPSLRILGGQAVQADRLLTAWKDDPDVEAWLVPVNPLPPRPLRFALNIRTSAPSSTRPPTCRCSSARSPKPTSSTSFRPGTRRSCSRHSPAMLIARALGKPVVLNYRSGEAPDHLQRSAVARAAIARVDKNVVPSRFLVEVFAASASTPKSSPTSSTWIASCSATVIRCVPGSCRRAISTPSTT